MLFICRKCGFVYFIYIINDVLSFSEFYFEMLGMIGWIMYVVLVWIFFFLRFGFDWFCYMYWVLGYFFDMIFL